MLLIVKEDILVFISYKLKVIKFMEYFFYKYLINLIFLDFNFKLILLNFFL